MFLDDGGRAFLPSMVLDRFGVGFYACFARYPCTSTMADVRG